MASSAPLVLPGDRLRPGWLKVCWLYGMLGPALWWGWNSWSPGRGLASLGLVVLTVGLGHSVGLHRGIIHRAFRTSRVMRGVLAWLAVQSGLGGPLAWVRSHYFRDYWQNRLDCPRYFAYDHSMARDYYWNLHLSLHSADESRYEMPAAEAHDPWLRWLERTWVWHVLALLGLIWWGWGFEAMIVCGPVRISASILGHWAVNFLSHKYGYARYDIAGAKEHGYNNWLLGALSFGEGFHNNHHAHSSSAKLSVAWYEIDLGWCLVRLLRATGLIWDVQAVGETPTQRDRARVRPLRRRWPWHRARRP